MKAYDVRRKSNFLLKAYKRQKGMLLVKVLTGSGIYVLGLAAFLFFFVASVSSAQTIDASGSSPREPIERFCKLDAEGKQLNPEGQTEATGMFVYTVKLRPSRAAIAL